MPNETNAKLSSDDCVCWDCGSTLSPGSTCDACDSEVVCTVAEFQAKAAAQVHSKTAENVDNRQDWLGTLEALMGEYATWTANATFARLRGGDVAGCMIVANKSLQDALTHVRARLDLAGADPTVSFQSARHIKTGNIYHVRGQATNATNAQDGQDMVIYQREGRTFVRKSTEFHEKFEVADP